MKRIKGEVLIATAIVLLVAGFCGLVAAGKDLKSADAENIQVSEAK